jgi:leucyl aminopeptidase
MWCVGRHYLLMEMTLTLKNPPADATPIRALTANDLAQYLSSAPAETRAWLSANDFRAQMHTHALLPGADGKISEVLLGVREANDVYAFAHLPLALPFATYALAEASIVNAETAALGWQLGAYQFTRYKKAKREPATLALADTPATQRATMIAASVKLVRDLVNTPTEDMGPVHLAAAAKAMAEEFGATFTECVGDDLIKQNFPAIHAAGRASDRPPRLIELAWGDEKHPRIAIVGKGVCFDTGGVNIKGADGMRWMKKDMGGGAHALALARLIMHAKLPVRLHMLVPAVENAISGNAYKPGDVISTRHGHTIEIGNTDAEGRVILSDALAYAAESKPEIIIDFATLTGAARVALGPELPATFANRDDWFTKLEAASAATQDPLWRMPLWQNYNALIDSNIADVNNTGGPQGGAITAALFLERFVPKEQAWIHIDTFAWNSRSRAGRPEGGEAQSLRAVFGMLEKQYRG